jgi:superfamily II DNA or RNA helicase
MQKPQAIDPAAGGAERLDPPRVVRIGARVRVRRERWSIIGLRAHDSCQTLMLRGIGPSNLGRLQRFLVPFESIESLDRRPRLRLVGRRRWRRACRAALGGVRPAGSLATAARARIDLMPHQLEPALAIVRGRASRVLLADEVGLGKTIQAGLIVSELQALGAADRVLVLAPAGLREQWSAELHERFGLSAAIVDMREARRRAALLPVGWNPWDTVPLAVASIDYAKRPEVLPAIRSCGWDVVIVDEAHGVTAGSDRHQAVHSLCERAAYVVLITATPHNGDRRAFESLCRLGAHAAAPADSLIIFRRNRDDASLGVRRRVHCLRVNATHSESLMRDRLAQLTAAIRSEHDEPGARLTLSILHKRAMSSAHSLQASILRRVSSLREDPREGGQLALPLDDGYGELDSSDEAPGWTASGLSDVERERKLLTAVAESAHQAAARESKLARLERLLSHLSRRDEPVIVFTEYRDTLLHMQRALQRFSSRIGVLHGGLARDERRLALDAFRSGRRPILLATDAGGEGLNLHQTCRTVVNLELPWNPMRLEQRIGRVDRIGQTRTVHAFNLVAAGSGESELLEHLKARVASARQQIDVADPLASPPGEEAAFRAIVLNESLPANRNDRPAARTRARADGETVIGECGILLNLAGEADDEHARLTFARRITVVERRHAVDPADDTLSDPDSLYAFARHPRTRELLASRLLVLLVTTIEDAAGRIVASQLSPVAVRSVARPSRAHAASLIRQILRALGTREIADSSAARPDLLRAFWECRLSRERGIAELLNHAHEFFQPGLFDRRAEHGADERARQSQHLAARLASIEAARLPGSETTRAALILFP